MFLVSGVFTAQRHGLAALGLGIALIGGPLTDPAAQLPPAMAQSFSGLIPALALIAGGLLLIAGASPGRSSAPPTHLTRSASAVALHGRTDGS